MREIKFDFVSKHDDGVSFIHEVYTLDEIMYTLPEYVYDGHPKKLFTIIAKRQYTGLKDKNGVEIYDGDIIQDCEGNVGRVTYIEDCCQFLINMGEGIELQEIGDWCEVIGDIYENPELLETK